MCEADSFKLYKLIVMVEYPADDNEGNHFTLMVDCFFSTCKNKQLNEMQEETREWWQKGNLRQEAGGVPALTATYTTLSSA